MDIDSDNFEEALGDMVEMIRDYIAEMPAEADIDIDVHARCMVPTADGAAITAEELEITCKRVADLAP